MAKARTEKTDVYTLLPDEEGVVRLTRLFPSGAKVVDNGADSFDAYDAKGRFLGFAEKSVAEQMAIYGRIGEPSLSKASDLSIWTLWNEAVGCGENVLEGDDGEQILGIGRHHFIRVTEDAQGWDVDILTDVELGDTYYDKDAGCFVLKFADKPFRLE